MQVLRPKALKAWNRLFDEHDLDAIMVPGFMHTPTMACGAAKTCAHRVLNLETGAIDNVANFTSLDNVMPSHMNKHVPLPKMMVPVGKDVEGRSRSSSWAARDPSARATSRTRSTTSSSAASTCRSSATSMHSSRRRSPRIRRSPASRRRW